MNDLDLRVPVIVLVAFFEARRLWRYKRYGIKDIHPGYRLIVTFDKPKYAKAFLRDVEKNWERYHLKPALFQVGVTLVLLAALYLF